MPILGLPAAMILVLTLAGPAVPSRAPSAEEQKAFSDGLRLYEAGDARGAERAWRGGYAVARDPAFLVRIGEAQEKAGASQEAARSYQHYLRESPGARDRDEIEARLQRLLPPAQRKPIEGEVPGDMRGATATPGASPTGVAPQAAPPAPSAAAAAPPPSAAPLPSAPVPAGAAAARPAGSGPGAVQAEDDAQDDPRPLFGDEAHRSRLNTTAWVGVGVTTLLLGTAAFFGASASEKAGNANRLLTFRDPDTGMGQEYALWADQYEEDLRLGRRNERWAKGLLIGAGVTALVSTVLFIVDGARAPTSDGGAQARARLPARRGPRLVGGGAGPAQPRLGLSWSF